MIFLVSSSSWAGLQFYPVNEKPVTPGSLAYHILPLKAQTDLDLRIETISNQGWAIEGPQEVKLLANAIEYLTFEVDVPSTALAGITHELELKFFDKTTNALIGSNKIFFLVDERNSIGIGPISSKKTTSQLSSKFPIQITNTGNVERTYNLEVENFTPQVKIGLTDANLTLAPGASQTIFVNINFSDRSGNLALFKVFAKSSLQNFKSQTFEVKLVGFQEKNANGETIESQITLSHEYLSVDRRTGHQFDLLAQGNGKLSDYVGLTYYLQGRYLNDKLENDRFHFRFEGDDWTVTLGDDLDVGNADSIMTSALRGARAELFFDKINVGVLAGVDRESHDKHIAADALYYPKEGQRFVVLHDQNITTNQYRSRVAYDGRFETLKGKLQFAPSLIVTADSEDTESILAFNRIRIQALKKLPVVLTTAARLKDGQNFYVQGAEASYRYNKFIFRLGGEIGKEQSKDEGYKQHQELNGVILFPIWDKLTGQASYRLMDNEDIKRHQMDLSLNFSANKFFGILSVGKIIQEQKSLDNNLFGEGDKNYISATSSFVADSFTISLNSYFEKDEFGASQLDIGLSTDIYPESWGDSRLNLELGYRKGKESDRLDSFKTKRKSELAYARARYHYPLVRNNKVFQDIDYQIDAWLGIDPVTKRQEYTVMNRLVLKRSDPVPNTVNQLFGGRKTGSLIAKICIDIDLNEKCDDGDEYIGGAQVRIDGKDIRSRDDGIAIIDFVEPGKKKPSINLASIPTGLRLIKEIQEVNIEKNKSTFIDILLEKFYFQKVITFLDRNENGIFDDGENILSDIEVNLSANGKSIDQKISNKSGLTFNNLSKGSYSLSAKHINGLYEYSTPYKVDFKTTSINTIYFGFKVKSQIFKPGNEKITFDLDDPVLRPPFYKAILFIESAGPKLQAIGFKIGGVKLDPKYYEIKDLSDDFMEIEFELKDFLKTGFATKLQILNLEIFLDASHQKQPVFREIELSIL